jgi:MFS family permease
MRFLRHLIPPPGPIRVLCASGMTRSIGHGILLSVSVLYFIRSVGIPAERVGIGLTIAAILGMLASIPSGHAADVLGPRATAAGFVCLQGLMIFGYAAVGDFLSFIVAASLVVMFESASDASRGALVAGVVSGPERVRARAHLRSINNIGLSLGAVAGGVALQYDTRPVYVGLIVLAGLLYISAGAVYRLLPAVATVAKPVGGPRWVVLRDRPFVALSLLSAVLVLNGGLLTVALPIWIAQKTAAPVWVYSAILIVNTVMVVLLQVRVSRGAEDVPGGARAMRRAGVLLALCCVLFGLAAGHSAWLAVIVLAAGAIAHVLGELLYSAGAWALSYELAPDHAQGQYQGVFGLTDQLGAALTPVIATTVVIRFGLPGWLAFGALLLGAGLAVTPVARWAQRTRPPELLLVAEPAT